MTVRDSSLRLAGACVPPGPVRLWTRLCFGAACLSSTRARGASPTPAGSRDAGGSLRGSPGLLLRSPPSSTLPCDRQLLLCPRRTHAPARQGRGAELGTAPSPLTGPCPALPTSGSEAAAPHVLPSFPGVHSSPVLTAARPGADARARQAAPRPLRPHLSVCFVLRAVATCAGWQWLLHRNFKERAGEDALDRRPQTPAERSGPLTASHGRWPAVGAAGPGHRGYGYEVHTDPPAVPHQVTAGTAQGAKVPAEQQEGRTLRPWDPGAAVATAGQASMGNVQAPLSPEVAVTCEHVLQPVLRGQACPLSPARVPRPSSQAQTGLASLMALLSTL